MWHVNFFYRHFLLRCHKYIITSRAHSAVLKVCFVTNKSSWPVFTKIIDCDLRTLAYYIVCSVTKTPKHWWKTCPLEISCRPVVLRYHIYLISAAPSNCAALLYCSKGFIFVLIFGQKIIVPLQHKSSKYDMQYSNRTVNIFIAMCLFDFIIS